MSVLGIIAGKGRLPARIVETCRAAGRPFFVLGFEGSTDPALLHDVPHALVRLGAIGDALMHLRRANAEEVVLAGGVSRPPLSRLMPDRTAAKLLARLGMHWFGGDDALFKTVVDFLEEEGFRVIGVEQVVEGLISPEGVLSKRAPTPQMLADIAHGMQVAKVLGAHDVGQAVVVYHGHVLAVEAAEGTDEMLARVATLKDAAPGGVLVKAKKPGQETRVDLPAIGPITVQRVAQATLAAIAIEAGGALILDRDEVLRSADALGLCVVGVRHG